MWQGFGGGYAVAVENVPWPPGEHETGTSSSPVRPNCQSAAASMAAALST